MEVSRVLKVHRVSCQGDSLDVLKVPESLRQLNDLVALPDSEEGNEEEPEQRDEHMRGEEGEEGRGREGRGREYLYEEVGQGLEARDRRRKLFQLVFGDILLLPLLEFSLLSSPPKSRVFQDQRGSRAR